MDEILRPTDDVLAALATQMGLSAPAPADTKKPSETTPATPPAQKSYSQLT